MKETRARSIVKTISWRALATLTTAALVYIATGSFALAFQVGAFEVVLKLIIYYFHERGWALIKWGIIHSPKSHLTEVMPTKSEETAN